MVVAGVFLRSNTKVLMLQTWRLVVPIPLIDTLNGWRFLKCHLSGDVVNKVWLLTLILNESVFQVAKR